jgi:hypothetical protein
MDPFSEMFHSLETGRWMDSGNPLISNRRMHHYFSCSVQRERYPCYRPWRPIGLREVEAPTFLRQTANRWRQGCQLYSPAALYPPGRFLVLISVRG